MTVLSGHGKTAQVKQLKSRAVPIPVKTFIRTQKTMLAVIAICVGASVGALSRWGLAMWLSPGALVPWGTLAANLVGGYLIGMAIAVLQSLPHIDPIWRLLLVTGFLGGLTTFSTFSAEVMGFLMEARYGLALMTASMHVLGSLLMTFAGIKTALFFIANNAR